MGNFRLVMVDAVSLGNMPNVNRAETLRFVDSASNNTELVTVLITHIPLWRPLNQRKPTPVCLHGLREATYYDFQNALNRETSQTLLDALKPVLVLSGHSCVCMLVLNDGFRR